MLGRDVIGRRIIGVKQRTLRTRTHGTESAVSLDAIVLHDGTEIRFVVAETDFGEYIVQGVIRKPNNRDTTPKPNSRTTQNP